MHTTSSVDNIDEYLETVVKKDDGVLLQATAPKSGAMTTSDDHRAVQDRERAWRSEDVHGLPHAPRADRARGGRQVGGGAADAGAAEGAHAVVLADEGDEPARRSARRWTCTRTRRTTRSTPTPTATSPTSTPTSSRSATRSSTGPSRWTAAIPPPSGSGLLSVDESPNVVNPANGWIQNTNNWPYSVVRAAQPEEGAVPGLRGRRQREPARRARGPGAVDARKDFTSTR